jgi:hypothetical protein
MVDTLRPSGGSRHSSNSPSSAIAQLNCDHELSPDFFHQTRSLKRHGDEEEPGEQSDELNVVDDEEPHANGEQRNSVSHKYI